MIYFTSDLHFGDHRLNFNGRDMIADTATAMNELIVAKWNSVVKDKDTVYVLGDVALDKESFEYMNELNGKKILIKGNYDEEYDDEFLLKYFEEVHDSYTLERGKDIFYLNHYPEKCDDLLFNLCGHIHDKWKVQRNMINVSLEVWNFYPVSIDRILFTKNAIENHYDTNVFAGELECNLKNKK